jgi:hypothetical protein
MGAALTVARLAVMSMAEATLDPRNKRNAGSALFIWFPLTRAKVAKPAIPNWEMTAIAV